MKEMQTFLKKYHEEMNWEINNEGYEKSRASLLNNYMVSGRHNLAVVTAVLKEMIGTCFLKKTSTDFVAWNRSQ